MQKVYRHTVSVEVEINGKKTALQKISYENYDHCWEQIEKFIKANKKEGDEVITHHIASNCVLVFKNEYES